MQIENCEELEEREKHHNYTYRYTEFIRCKAKLISELYIQKNSMDNGLGTKLL